MALAETLHNTRDSTQVSLRYNCNLARHFNYLLLRFEFRIIHCQYVRPNSAPCLPMNDEGEGVDHIMMKVKEINYEVLSKMNIETGTDGEYQDHDGVRLKIQEEN